MIEMKNVRVIAFAQLDGDDFSKQQGKWLAYSLSQEKTSFNEVFPYL